MIGLRPIDFDMSPMVLYLIDSFLSTLGVYDPPSVVRDKKKLAYSTELRVPYLWTVCPSEVSDITKL